MKLRIGLILGFLALSIFAHGQGVFIPPQTAFKVVNGITSPIANATITVCAAGASGIPCSPALVGTIFRDIALTQPLPNPFTADATGNYQFAAAANNYTVTVTALGFGGNSYQVSLGAGTSGNISGGGTPGTLPLWTAPTAIGDSTLTSTTVGVLTDTATSVQPGANWILQTDGLFFNPIFPSGNGTVNIKIGNVTGKNAPSYVIAAGNTNGTNSAGGVVIEAGNNAGSTGPVLNLAGPSVGSAGNYDSSAGVSATSLAGGDYIIRGGPNVSSGAGGNIEMLPGAGASIVQDGVVYVASTNPTTRPHSFYPGTVSFGNLATPRVNPSNGSNKGAIQICIDCMGAADGAAVGSIAAGSGTGALIEYDATNWRVVSGAAGTGTVQITGTPTATQISQWVNATHIQGITDVPIGKATGTNATLSDTSAVDQYGLSQTWVPTADVGNCGTAANLPCAAGHFLSTPTATQTSIAAAVLGDTVWNGGGGGTSVEAGIVGRAGVQSGSTTNLLTQYNMFAARNQGATGGSSIVNSIGFGIDSMAGISGVTNTAQVWLKSNTSHSFPGSGNFGFYQDTAGSTTNFFGSPTTFAGNVTAGAHLNQTAAGNWAGTCAMSAGTTCTITLSAVYGSTPGCIVSQQSSGAVIAGECSVSGTTVTITAASANSATWAAMLFGNPN